MSAWAALCLRSPWGEGEEGARALGHAGRDLPPRQPVTHAVETWLEVGFALLGRADVGQQRHVVREQGSRHVLRQVLVDVVDVDQPHDGCQDASLW